MANILTITLNPAIDITIELDELHIGAVNRQHQVTQHAAGKGLNVAQVLHDLGHHVVVSGFLGEKNKAIFQQHFQNMQFDDQFIYLDDETRQNIKIAEQSGRMTDVNGQGFQVTEADKTALLQRLESLSHAADFVVIAGSLPKGFSTDDLQSLIQLFKQKNKKIAIDSSGKALVAAIACDPWMIKPNTDELFESYGVAVETVADQQKLFQSLDSQIRHIVISMGEHGVNWIRPDQILQAQPAKVSVKSTVGAGDSLLAGMIHGIASELTDADTLITATAIASHAVTQVGFRVPDTTRLNDLKLNTTIKTLS